MTREREMELRAWAADLHALPTQCRAEMREVFAALDEAREDEASVAATLADVQAQHARALGEAKKSREIDRMLLAEARAGWKRALDERDELRNAICEAWR